MAAIALSESARHHRSELLTLTLKELLGPAGGPDEVVAEDRVSNRYAIGMLYPKGE